MSRNHLIVYHANCNDGLTAAAVIYHHIRKSDPDALINTMEAQYDKETDNKFTDLLNVLQLQATNRLWIVDFSYPLRCIKELQAWESNDPEQSFVLLDHHKSALELLNEPSCIINEYNAMSGAMMAAFYYNDDLRGHPLIVAADDYDRWQFKAPNTKEIVAGMKFLKPEVENLAKLFGDVYYPQHVFEVGKTILEYQNKQVAAAAYHCFENPVFCTTPIGNNIAGVAVNHSDYDILSQLGNMISNSRDLYSHNYGVTPLYTLLWKLISPTEVLCSLRCSDAQLEDLQYKHGTDCSQIAKMFGGGGHAQAAGFKLPPSEFFLWLDTVKTNRVSAL